MEDVEKKESYKSLIEKFLNKIGNISVSGINQLVQSLVESRRTASVIMSVKDLIQVLEERDYVNEDRLDGLEKILEYCQKANLLSDASELQDEIHLHKKEFDCPSNNKCQICSKDVPDIIELIQCSPTAPPLYPMDLSNHQFQSEINETDAMINYISLNIGKDWRQFASLLKVRERKIRDIHKKYGDGNTVKAACEVLSEWRKHSRQKSEIEKQHILIECLQRKRIFNLSHIANDIINGEHIRVTVNAHLDNII